MKISRKQTVKWVLAAMGHPTSGEYAEEVAEGHAPMNMAIHGGDEMVSRMHGKDKKRELLVIDIKPDDDGRVVLMTKYVRLNESKPDSTGPVAAHATHVLACELGNISRAIMLANAINDTIDGTRYIVDMRDFTVYTEDVLYLTGDTDRDRKRLEEVRDTAVRSNMLYLPLMQAIRAGNEKELLNKVLHHDSVRELLDYDPDFELNMVPVEELSRRHDSPAQFLAGSNPSAGKRTQKTADDVGSSDTNDGGEQHISMRIEKHDFSGDGETDTRP